MKKTELKQKAMVIVMGDLKEDVIKQIEDYFGEKVTDLKLPLTTILNTKDISNEKE